MIDQSSKQSNKTVINQSGDRLINETSNQSNSQVFNQSVNQSVSHPGQ